MITIEVHGILSKGKKEAIIIITGSKLLHLHHVNSDVHNIVFAHIKQSICFLHYFNLTLT